MIPWSTVGKIVLLFGMVAGSLYYVSESRYAAGYAKGVEVGEAKGVKDTNEKRDATALAQNRERDNTELDKLNQLNQFYRDKEQRLNEDKERDRIVKAAQLASVVTARDAALDELHRASAEARDQIRDADRRARLSQAAAIVVTRPIPPVVLSERSKEYLIKRGAESDELNISFAECTARYEALRK